MKSGIRKMSGIYIVMMVLFLVLITFYSTPIYSSGSWPMFLHDPQHTGNTTSIAPEPVTILWSVPELGGNNWSSPVVANDRIFVINNGILYALYDYNGTRIWNRSIGLAGKGSSTPALVDGKAYVIGDKLYCFYENNGTEIWNKPLSGLGTGTSSPVVAEGKVYVNTGNFYSFYAGNGTEIWNKSVGGSGESTPAFANGKVLVNGQKLYCFYVNNGTEIWNTTGGGSNSPVIANGKVFYNPGQIKVLYENNGSEVWSQPNGGDGYSSPAIGHGKVFVHTLDRVKCYYENNGTEIWDVPLPGQGRSTPAISGDGKVIVIGWNNIVGGITYCLNGGNGAMMWNYTTGGDGHSSPAMADGRVFVNEGTVYCFGPPIPTIDYIQIRDAAGGGGSVVGTRNYSAQEVDEFYAAAYNNTAGYLIDVEVEWSSSNTSVGQVDSPGIWTNFTTLVVSKDSNCTVNATYGPGISNSTGTLTTRVILNFILIRDNPYALYDEVVWISINGGETRTYYVAGYNATTGVFMRNVVVNWSISNGIGSIDTARGYSTNFTATNVTGVDVTGTLTVVYEGSKPLTTGIMPITVGVEVDLLPAAPTGVTVSQRALGESLVLRWTASPESDVLGYNIFRSETSGSNFSVIASIIGAANTYHLDTGLVDNTTYYYYIVAFDGGPNYSPSSDVVSGVSDIDTDLNGLYNLVDKDDDGDGLSDIEEIEAGLDPLSADTDGDGYSDKKDLYPLDPDRWEKSEESPMFLVIIPIIVGAVVLLLLIFILLRKWKKSGGTP